MVLIFQSAQKKFWNKNQVKSLVVEVELEENSLEVELEENPLNEESLDNQETVEEQSFEENKIVVPDSFMEWLGKC